MEDMWKSRQKPVPLDFEALESAPSASDSLKSSAIIRDQKQLSVKDSFDLFVDRYVCLACQYTEPCTHRVFHQPGTAR